MSSIFDSKLNRTLATLALIGVVVALASYSYVMIKQSVQWGGSASIT
jgi:hypothetical protein